MSQASANSLPMPRVAPRIEAMVTTGELLNRVKRRAQP
jgi:hypothetical protein